LPSEKQGESLICTLNKTPLLYFIHRPQSNRSHWQ